MTDPTGEYCENCVDMIPRKELDDHCGDGLCGRCRELLRCKTESAIHKMTNVDLANRIVRLRAALREIAVGGSKMPDTHLGTLACEIGRVRRVAAEALAAEGVSLSVGT